MEHSEGWVVHSSSSTYDVKDKPHSGWPCTAVTPENEGCINQHIHVNCLMVVTLLKNSFVAKSFLYQVELFYPVL